jgi:hypothetical protein
MSFLDLFRKPTPQPLRHVIATKRENLAEAVRRINKHNELAVANALFPREYLPTPHKEKRG